MGQVATPKTNRFIKLLQSNLLSFISLCIAFTALTYNTWRNELTEQNRNERAAAFEILKQLSALQLIADFAHYDQDAIKGNSITGWGHVALIEDLSVLMPDYVMTSSSVLKTTWQTNAQLNNTNNQANQTISAAIKDTREQVLMALSKLK